MDTEATAPSRRYDDKRPTVLSEIRAWMIVAATLVFQIVGGVWWAATLSEQNRSMQGLLIEVRRDMKEYALKADVERRFEETLRNFSDHEVRLRQLEQRRAQ